MWDADLLGFIIFMFYKNDLECFVYQSVKICNFDVLSSVLSERNVRSRRSRLTSDHRLSQSQVNQDRRCKSDIGK